MNIDYNDLEDDTDNMSIEIVTNDFCEDTNRQISNESINCIKSSDIDVELNAGKILILYEFFNMNIQFVYPYILCKT